ncbi:rhombosortase [Shewanella sp. GXUN23E]|uniref:rhombosortase n=1 Tax=Shewanella sp. GXUN23E TaxID=3422498 RepID=UPI003D7C6A7B
MQRTMSQKLNSPWGVALLLSLLAAALYGTAQYASTLDGALAFRRTLIGDGQWYRLLTGNLLHTNHWHLLMNLAGLWVIIALFRWPFRFAGFTLLFLTLCALEGVGLYLFYPSLMGYVGLSGVLHGLFAFGATREVLGGIKMGWALLGGLILKVGYETVTGGSADLAQLINARVAVESHLVGAVAGILLALLYSLGHRWYHSAPKTC